MFTAVIEKDGIEEYLSTRGLIAQYKKVKSYLLSGQLKAINFAKRKPYDNGICYFRINRKYRVWWYIDGSCFVVVKIDDHQ